MKWFDGGKKTGTTGKTVAIIVGGTAGVGFLVICLLFVKNLMKKKYDGILIFILLDLYLYRQCHMHTTTFMHVLFKLCTFIRNTYACTAVLLISPDFGCKILSDIPNPPHMSSFMYKSHVKVKVNAYQNIKGILYIRALVEKKSKIELSLIS